MGAEQSYELICPQYFTLAAQAGDGTLSERMGRGREALTAMLAGRLLDGGGQLFVELCFLEMLLCEWVHEARMIEVRREQCAHRPPWYSRWLRRGA
jgi:hypothetical protein